jgi:spartin
MTHEAFLLLTLPDVELTAPGVRERGTLELECLTVPAAPTARDVFLVLKLGRYETVIDPERHVTVSTTIPTERTYHLHGTPVDPNAITIRVLAGEKSGDTLRAADIETFDAILEQYASFTPGAPHAERTDSGAAYHLSDGKEDLRGRLVLVDQDNGEVLGTVGDSRTAIHEDPSITRRGHEHEPVVIDVGPGGELESARDIFVRAIPEREQTMMTRGASMLRYVDSPGDLFCLSYLTRPT